MEQALGNEAAPSRVCAVSGSLANEMVHSQLTGGSDVQGCLMAVQAIAF